MKCLFSLNIRLGFVFFNVSLHFCLLHQFMRAKRPLKNDVFRRYDHLKIYQNVVIPIFLYTPTIGVILMSSLIAVSVRSHIRHSQSTEIMQKKLTKEKQAMLQLFLIAMSFLIGYLPFTGKNIWVAQSILKRGVELFFEGRGF